MCDLLLLRHAIILSSITFTTSYGQIEEYLYLDGKQGAYCVDVVLSGVGLYSERSCAYRYLLKIFFS